MLRLPFLFFIAVLVVLALIAVYSRKGNPVSVMARGIPQEPAWGFWTGLALVFIVSEGGLLSWLAFNTDSVNDFVIPVLMLVVFGMVLAATLFKASHTIFITAAPIAAAIGEELTEEEKQKLLRTTVQCIRRFDRWWHKK